MKYSAEKNPRLQNYSIPRGGNVTGKKKLKL